MSQTELRFINPLFALIAVAGTATCGALAAETVDTDRTDEIREAALRDAISQAPEYSPIKVGGEIQFRYNANFDAEQGGDDFESGFQSARTRLKVSGGIPNSDLSYSIVGNFSHSDGSFGLDDALIDWKPEGHFALRMGQFKLPFSREYAQSGPTSQLAVDRSIADATFRADRSQGIQLTYTYDRFRLYGAFSDGRKAKGTDYNDTDEGDAAITTRAEFRLGEAGWKQYKDMTSFRGDDNGILIGVAAHWQQDGVTTAPAAFGDNVNYLGWTADLSFEGNGWNALVAVFGRHLDGNDMSLSEYAFTVQGGLFVTDKTEVFARYSHIIPDDSRAGGTDEFGAVTLGFNYYVFPDSHAFKFTVEGNYFPEALANSSSVVSQSTYQGLLSDSDDDQFGLVAQVQLLF